MKAYALELNTDGGDRTTVALLRQHGLEPYVSPWTRRLCATVRAEESVREGLAKELSVIGLTPKWAEIVESQSA